MMLQKSSEFAALSCNCAAMDWNDLRFVLEVGRRRTLAAAGRVLGVDPTTVGRRIIAIETEIRARLFDRTGDGYLATAAGEIAISLAQEMERVSTTLAQRIAGSDARIEGSVRIAGLDLLFDALIIPRIKTLLDRYPGLEITFSSSIDSVDLSRREADIALHPKKPVQPYAVGRRLARLAMGAFVARDLPISGTPPVIGLALQHESTSYSRFVRELFPDSPVVARGNTEHHLLSLTRAGVGVGLIDCFVGDLDPLLRRALPEPVDYYETWAVVHVDMHKSPRVRAVLDFLTEAFSADADLLEGRRPSAIGRPEAVATES